MLRRTALLALLASLVTCTPDDADDGRFPCGDHGGTCDAATELCITGVDRCSTCVPLPATCDPEATCGCIPPGDDPMWAPHECLDPGTCAANDGGLVLTCEELDWGCG